MPTWRQDVPGFRQIGKQSQLQDVSITSIGVGLNYNERILSALSRESGGRSYFAPDEQSLQGIFDAETKTLGSVVATSAEARIELGPTPSSSACTIGPIVRKARPLWCRLASSRAGKPRPC